MKPELKSLIIELFILITVFTATWLIMFWLIGAKDVLNPAMQMDLRSLNAVFHIRLTDTFHLPWLSMVFESFLMLVTIVYFIKEGFFHFKRKLQNFILVISNFAFVIQVTNLLTIARLFERASRIKYPPLSALPIKKPDSKSLDDIILWEHVMFLVLIIFMLTLVVSVFFAGKNWQSAPSKSQ